MSGCFCYPGSFVLFTTSHCSRQLVVAESMVTSFYIHWLNGMQLFSGVSWRKLLRNHNPAINQANLGEINLINRSIAAYEKFIERELKAFISCSCQRGHVWVRLSTGKTWVMRSMSDIHPCCASSGAHC